MNDTHTPSNAAAVFTDWMAQERDYKRLMNELRPANKTVLFDSLAAAGIAHVIVAFNGEGDSGQIEDIAATCADAVIVLPPDQIELAFAVWGKSEIERHSLSVHDALERLTYDFLGDTHGGWENNDGAYGEFLFDVAERTITLDFNERHMESENHTHEF